MMDNYNNNDDKAKNQFIDRLTSTADLVRMQNVRVDLSKLHRKLCQLETALLSGRETKGNFGSVAEQVLPPPWSWRKLKRNTF